jgi:hypothetical protein
VLRPAKIHQTRFSEPGLVTHPLFIEGRRTAGVE